MDKQTTTVQISTQERDLLAEVLESAYRDLKQEIGRTEDSRFKAELQARRDTLGSLIQKLVGRAAINDEF